MSDDVHDTNIVVVGLITRDGKIFIAKRADTKKTLPGQFEIPGGHVDPGEQPEQALERELFEELGVHVHVGRPVFAFTYESEDTFKVEIVYLCTLAADSSEPVLDPTDHSDSLWIGEDEMSKMAKDDEEVIAIRRAFEMLKNDKELEQGA